MRPGVVIIVEVLSQDAMQMGLVQHNHMIQTIAAYAADDSFAKWILPRRAWCDQNFLNTHVLDSLLEVFAVDAVADRDGAR